MAKKVTFEIYEGLTSRKKKYVVVPEKCPEHVWYDAITYLMKLNHCSGKHIYATTGYILNGLLYLGTPENKKAKFVHVLTYVR